MNVNGVTNADANERSGYFAIEGPVAECRRFCEPAFLLDSEQIGIKSMSLSEPTLDDVFLRQTGRSLRDTGATDARSATEVAA